MVTYLVVHSPRDQGDGEPERPTDLVGLARSAVAGGLGPRWLQTWSPDLHDDRIFSLWEAQSAEEIQRVLERFRFLTNMDVQALHVRSWGPDDVLAADSQSD